MRRVACEALDVFPELTETFLFGAVVAAVLGVRVVHGSVGHQCFEGVRFAEQRRSEIAAEAAAARSHALAVDPRLSTEPIGGLDGVLIRRPHPFLGDGISPRLPEAARAMEVVP